MIRVFLFMAAIMSLYSQAIVPGQAAQTTRIFRNGSNQQEYFCTAYSKQANYSWTGSSMITSIVDSGTTATITFVSAHGLNNDNSIQILGVTEVGGTALNSTFTVTVTSTTAVTITTSGVTDGSYTPSGNPSMSVNTTAPLTFRPIWQIAKQYWTSTYNDGLAYADGDSSWQKICDNRASYSYN